MNSLNKENLHKEIDLIQECIKRMSSNSFLLKGWTISLVAVVIALSEKAVSLYLLCLILIIPLVSFWYLDAFFLYTEKLYRAMYDWVLNKRMVENSNEFMFDLNPQRFKKDLKDENGKAITIWSTMFSRTLRAFYLIPIIVIIAIVIYSSCFK
ncbi:hypothetical protein FOC33_15500 [Plesiomonas shigelloides]|uniref:hypothetical protein n=1 Tax=Plesiomonas shigelloides TaxID=703 RepID=UPI00143E2E37|nr:hypothetical protein [Plesiomonas shigelloides]QIY10185.1 hypothetical protein FOC33_15500 [Plesiomonas shigelloides]